MIKPIRTKPIRTEPIRTENDAKAFGDAIRQGAAMIQSLRPEDWAALGPICPPLNPKNPQ